jgi:hypothetical protein
MKKIVFILLPLLVISSCKKWPELNENTKDPTSVTGESLFTGGQTSLFFFMVTPNVNLNNARMYVQHWTETTYTDEANYDLVSRGIPDNMWMNFPMTMNNFKEAYEVILNTTYVGENPAVKKNKLACTQVLMVYLYGILVETFGNIPYSQSLDINNLQPVYDDGLAVSRSLIKRLDDAIADMDSGFEGFASGDNMYRGDMVKWKKFASSLKLHLGMLIADADESLARATVESAAPHVISSNDDNAAIQYLSTQPNTNPVYDAMVGWGERYWVAANTLVDTLNNWNDPRRPFYFTQVDTSTEQGVIKLAYVGGIYGLPNDYEQYSHISDKIKNPTFEGMIFDLAQTEFLLAEAVERGFNVGGTAAGHYENGVRASILYWGGTGQEADEYLADPRIGYATAPGTFRQKIGMQMWIALYNRGFEAWTQWRRYDFPLLVAPPRALSPIPLRYIYPVSEQTLNRANWEAASAAIGGDFVTTKLFWDRN